MPPSHRALTTDQKQARRAVILKVVLDRFTETPYDALTMDQIAVSAGVAKGTLYLYFRSKEELFLALYEQELERWFHGLDTALEHNRNEISLDRLLQILSTSLKGRPVFLRLTAILHTVLERNIDHVTAQRFQKTFRDHVRHSGGRLEAALPFLKPGQGADLLLKIYALVIGFQHLTQPALVMNDVLKESELAFFKVNLTDQLLDTVRLLLMGLAYQSKYAHDR